MDASAPCSSKPPDSSSAPPKHKPMMCSQNASDNRCHSPSSPPVEALTDLNEIAQQLKTYDEEQHLPSNHPDVIALRTAASILQGQRQRLLDGISNLDQVMMRAERDPLGLFQDIKTGVVTPKGESGTLLYKALQQMDSSTILTQETTVKKPLLDFSSPAWPSNSGSSTPDSDKDSAIGSSESNPGTVTWPESFEVAKAPHIKWGNYWVSGDGLDRLHQETPAVKNSELT